MYLYPPAPGRHSVACATLGVVTLLSLSSHSFCIVSGVDGRRVEGRVEAEAEGRRERDRDRDRELQASNSGTSAGVQGQTRQYEISSSFVMQLPYE